MREMIILFGILGGIVFYIYKYTFKKHEFEIVRDILKSLFIIYFSTVLYFTFAIYLSVAPTGYWEWNVNIIPLKETINMFKNNVNIALYQVVGNILMFVPFGIFVPGLYKKENNILRVGMFSIRVLLENLHILILSMVKKKK